MWKLCIICDNFRIFWALKNPEIRKNPENSHACLLFYKEITQGPVFLNWGSSQPFSQWQGSFHFESSLSANGWAAFIESCPAIGQKAGNKHHFTLVRKTALVASYKAQENIVSKAALYCKGDVSHPVHAENVAMTSLDSARK